MPTSRPSEKEAQASELQIPKDLMEQLQTIAKRRDDVQTLVSKADISKDKVKPEIFERVFQDYQARLKKIGEELAPVAEEVRRRLIQIRERETDLRSRLATISDDIEEQRFRFELGEFPKAELDKVTKDLQSEHDNVKEQLSVAEETFEACKNAVGADLTEGAPMPSPRPVEAPSVDIPQEPAPVEAKAPAEPQQEPEPESKVRAVPPPPPPDAIEEEPETAAAPAGRPPQTAPALRLVKKNGETETFPLEADTLSIGRSPKSDIVLKMAGVSRTHAKLVRTGNAEYRIVDASGGGLSVNGKKTKEADIKVGDRIGIASAHLEIVPPSP